MVRSLISLKKSMQEQEAREIQENIRLLESRAREALRAYARAIDAVAQNALRACPPLEPVYKPVLLQLGLSLIGDTPPNLLDSHVATLSDTLQRFGDDAQRDFETKGDEIREVLRILASATDAIALQAETGSEQLIGFATEIERISEAGTLVEIRRRLRNQVREMRLAIDSARRANAAKLSSLESEMAAIRARLALVEAAAATDELTKVATLQVVAREAHARIGRSQTFSVLLFDIRRFRLINENHGAEAGDGVLREFASRLRAGVRPTDVVGRWPDDRFLVLLDCGLRDAMMRARQLHAATCGRYALKLTSGEVRVDVTAAMAVGECRTGESWQQLLDRLSDMLAIAGTNDSAPF